MVLLSFSSAASASRIIPLQRILGYACSGIAMSARDRLGLARDDYPATMLAQYISLRRETAQEQATQS